MAKHAHPKDPGTGIAPVLLALLAVGLAAAVLLVDSGLLLRLSVATLGLVGVAVALSAWRSANSLNGVLVRESQRTARELGELRRQLTALQEVTASLAGELNQLRIEVADYLLPVPSEPDPVYPSLHLPLLRAAFAVEPEHDAQVLMWSPPNGRGEVPPTVAADAGSEGRGPHQVLDLTQGQRRHAAGA